MHNALLRSHPATVQLSVVADKCFSPLRYREHNSRKKEETRLYVNKIEVFQKIDSSRNCILGIFKNYMLN